MASARKPKRPLKRTILIATNGLKTEKTYLNEMKRRLDRHDVQIRVEFINGEPESVLRSLRSPNGDASAYDEIWIVVDEDGKDRSKFVADCRKLCGKKQKWFAVVSRPCFEVWLIAHYEPVRSYHDQDHAQQHFTSLVPPGTPKKTLPGDFPYEQIDKAMARCRLRESADCAEHALPPSPGSAMPVLVRSLRA